VKPDVDTLLTVPDDPPAPGPDRALDPPPPDAGLLDELLLAADGLVLAADGLVLAAAELLLEVALTMP
jgi:hypothetical protein